MLKINIAKYIGIPYKFKGTSFTEGMDCATILSTYYKEIGFDFPVPEYSKKDINTMKLAKIYIRAVAELAENNQIVNRVEDLKINDLVCFTVSNGLVGLSGICVDRFRILCLPHQEMSILLKLDTPVWKSKFKFGVRFK